MPSILDGLPKSEAEIREIQESSAALVGQYMASAELTPKSREIFERLGGGESLADIMGITKEQRDALLVQGYRQFQGGDIAGAQNTLTQLYHFEPTDERVIYALAATYQAQEKYAEAGKLYVTFLAFDATNPQGYLRIGECFLANREFDDAKAYFEAAKIQAAGTKEAPAVNAHADSMLSVLASRSGVN